MKTRTFLFAITLMGNVACAMAQDMIVLHMKDGTTRRYINGVKDTTTIRLYEFIPEVLDASSNSTQHANGYSCQWNVSRAWHYEGKYAVAIIWQDDLPANFEARHGLCFGSEPGLTVDHCDSQKHEYLPGSGSAILNIYRNGTAISTERYHIMTVGYDVLPMHHIDSWEDGVTRYRLSLGNNRYNYMDTTLEYGQTYYYRTFAEVKTEEGGQEKTTILYGLEESFRVPRVMDDFAYYPYPQGTEEAMKAFAANFPTDVKAPTWKEVEPLWNLWRATDEGKAIDLSADITTAEFDDGTGYRLNRIPKEFYTWMTNREIVIDAFDGLVEIGNSDALNSSDYNYQGPFVPYLATADSIDNVDEKWGVPGGRYIRFNPTKITLNVLVSYGSVEVVPGVNYKILLNFAPETPAETLAENVSDPSMTTKITVTATSGGYDSVLFVKTEIPATTVTTLEVPNYRPAGMGLSLVYRTDVTNLETRRNLYNKVMRIAQIRLIPLK